MRYLRFVCVLMLLGLLSVARGAEPGKVDFNRDIKPILSNVCFDCHGPDASQRMADARFDVKDEVFKERGGYSYVVPGKPEDSVLFLRLIDPNERQRMPPRRAIRKINEQQIDLIEKWIKQGAEWKGHWAYEKPTRPAEPEIAADGSFVRNGIDRFVLNRLREQGLAPSPEADRLTLIRRLSFDLTGLPPTPKDVAQFVADASPDAYEKLVDRFLASPHFGERMATFWLDLVRYADTNGYHSDNHQDRDMYRDWVIRAFNDDVPFDRFTRDQLAGDLLPDATTAMRIASGYNRLLMTTQEGGAQAKEYLAKYSADRVRNLSTVWLAGTMGCCECHDHKYDPFTTRDFYNMAAFFADIQEVAVGDQPGTKVPTADENARLSALDARIQALKAVIDTPTAELEAGQLAWEGSARTRTVEWTPIRPTESKSTGGATLTLQDDGAILVSGAAHDKDVYELKFRLPAKGITALRLEALPDDSLPAKGPGRADNGNFLLQEMTVAVDGKPVEWSNVTATHSQARNEVKQAVDGKPATAWGILDHAGRESAAVFELKTELLGEGESTLAITLTQNQGGKNTLGKFRFSVTGTIRPIVADGPGLATNVTEALAVEPGQRSDEQKKTIATFYRSVAPALAATRGQLADVQKERDGVYAAVRTTLVSMSGAPRMIRVLPRGNWQDDSGEVVQPAPPGFLSPKTSPGEGRLTRVDLANWLVSPENPLTARVFVNRLWKLTFGQGLVKTVEDFGAQGTPPTHPDLLDWLAVEFREGEQQRTEDRGQKDTAGVAPPSIENPKSKIQNPFPWGVKRILKLIVMSGTYRQSSHANESLQQRDPFNNWLARQGRYRLDAEMVRDNALAVSGLLVDKLGGPSTRPYQPAGYWAYLNFPVREWQNDTGDGQYRRGLYTYWCRTFLQPSLKALDAPTREECTAERPRSNTPLQALVLLNDPTYVEAARAFAERILREGGPSVDSRLDYAFSVALSRPPRPEEAKLLKALYERHREQYRTDAVAAEALLHVGLRPVPEGMNAPELAAWTSVARAVFNLHELVTRN